MNHVPVVPTPEQQLVQRAQAGEAEAFTELYRRHSPAVYRYCLFRVRDAVAAEDLVSEVFLRAVEGLPRYVDRGAPLAAWLFRIAHDRVVDHHRRAANRPAEALSDHLPDRQPGTEAQAIDRLEANRLTELLAQLTEEQQMVVQLRFIEGYSIEEAARLMEKTTGAIKALQHRALRQMARQLARPA
jgi:RNA polymerase sigma-70 factor (ECF subfamily)